MARADFKLKLESAGDGAAEGAGSADRQGGSSWQCLPHQAAHVPHYSGCRVLDRGLRPGAVRAVKRAGTQLASMLYAQPELIHTVLLQKSFLFWVHAVSYCVL